MGFAENLKSGQLGESRIARWLRSRGNSVLPVYDVEMNTGKGPRLFAPSQQLIAPDMFVFKSKNAYWIEAKHKTAFTWHRLTQRWTTGIDLCHYEDYCAVDDSTDWPVWLLFLHRGGRAKGDDMDSPVGLFGNALSVLRKCENHRHKNWGKSGMVYWAKESLKEVASLEDVIR